MGKFRNFLDKLGYFTNPGAGSGGNFLFEQISLEFLQKQKLQLGDNYNFWLRKKHAQLEAHMSARKNTGAYEIPGMWVQKIKLLRDEIAKLGK